MQALKELDRIKTMEEFIVIGHYFSQKHKYKHLFYFKDKSILKLDSRSSIATASDKNFEYFACLSGKQKPAN